MESVQESQLASSKKPWDLQLSETESKPKEQTQEKLKSMQGT